MLAINSQFEEHHIRQINPSMGRCQPGAPFGDAAGREESLKEPTSRPAGSVRTDCVRYLPRAGVGAGVQSELHSPNHATVWPCVQPERGLVALQSRWLPFQHRQGHRQ